MKHAFLAVPAVALFATGAFAQTDTTVGVTTGTDTGTTVDATTSAGMEASSESFGANWPLSVGTTFFTDAESSALRTPEDLSSGWQSLSQEDRDMIKADCVTFMEAHGDTSTEASTSTTTGTDTTAGAATDGGTATDTATTDTATDTTAGASTGTASTDGTIATAVGYDMTEMKAICEAVGTL